MLFHCIYIYGFNFRFFFNVVVIVAPRILKLEFLFYLVFQLLSKCFMVNYSSITIQFLKKTHPSFGFFIVAIYIFEVFEFSWVSLESLWLAEYINYFIRIYSFFKNSVRDCFCYFLLNASWNIFLFY